MNLVFQRFNVTPVFPSAHFAQVETVEYKNISFTVWDVGGQDKVRGRRRMEDVGQDHVLTSVFPCTDPPSVEALLPKHTGPYLRGGQQ